MGNDKPILRNLEKRHNTIGFSSGSRKRMLERLRNFMFIRNFEFKGERVCLKESIDKLTLLTLTLPAKQEHKDTEIKARCFDNFMNKVRKKHGNVSYIWRAESQENGNIHFHIILNVTLDRNVADKWWHDSIELLGYVTLFEKKWKHRNPPTNRIEFARSVRKVMAYCAKYIAKVETYRKIEGCNWFSSKDIQTEAKANIIMSRKDELTIKRKLRKLGLFEAVNDYSSKFYFNMQNDYKELPMKIRNIYEDLIRYNLGRQFENTGMEREIRLEANVRLNDYTEKRKIGLRGYEMFPDNLFDSIN